MIKEATMKKQLKYLSYTVAILVVLLIFQFSTSPANELITNWLSLESIQVFAEGALVILTFLLPLLKKPETRKFTKRYYSARSVLLADDHGLYVQGLD